MRFFDSRCWGELLPSPLVSCCWVPVDVVSFRWTCFFDPAFLTISKLWNKVRWLVVSLFFLSSQVIDFAVLSTRPGGPVK